MNLKRKIAVSAAALLLIGSAMNVSAAELSSKDYVNTLIKNDQAELIIDVDAYKAAYSDLAQAFGNDTDAYINHYLTMGVYEGRTKGVLFDPLIYAEAYSDVKNALGYDIAAIVQHYLTFGIAENRTQGTAHGYSDIAAAEKAGVQSTNINRNVSSTGSSNLSGAYSNSAGSFSNNINTAGNVSSGNDSIVENVSSGDSGLSGSDSAGGTVAYANNSGQAGGTVAYANNSGQAVTNDNAGSSSSNTNSIAAADNSSSTAPVSADSASADTGKGYDHTTSIYDNDEKTLLRVEYYDESGKLIQYSSVTYSDSDSNSYTENIYHYDNETNTQILDRTDVYENGSLVSSVNQ